MAQIKKIINKEKNLTIFTVSGEFLLDQIIDRIEELYTSDFTLNLLWDLSHANTTAITRDQIEKIIALIKKYAHLREGGKSAYVMSSELGYGIARMFEIMSEMENLPVSQYAFKNFNEAMGWLEE